MHLPYEGWICWVATEPHWRAARIIELSDDRQRVKTIWDGVNPPQSTDHVREHIHWVSSHRMTETNDNVLTYLRAVESGVTNELEAAEALRPFLTPETLAVIDRWQGQMPYSAIRRKETNRLVAQARGRR